MHWQLKFSRSADLVGEEDEIVFFTSSPTKKATIVDHFTSLGFFLRGELRLEQELPWGFEDRSIRYIKPKGHQCK